MRIITKSTSTTKHLIVINNSPVTLRLQKEAALQYEKLLRLPESKCNYKQILCRKLILSCASNWTRITVCNSWRRGTHTKPNNDVILKQLKCLPPATVCRPTHRSWCAGQQFTYFDSETALYNFADKMDKFSKVSPVNNYNKSMLQILFHFWRMQANKLCPNLWGCHPIAIWFAMN